MRFLGRSILVCALLSGAVATGPFAQSIGERPDREKRFPVRVELDRELLGRKRI